jgi:hypothetical protein
MKIVGVDLSLTSTGIADDSGAWVIKVVLQKNAPEWQRTERLRRMARLVDRACRGADIVVMEGPSYASPYGVHALGELHGVVKVCLFQRGTPYVPIPPKKRAKYATDDGNAGKVKVATAAVRDGADIYHDDSADAWWLRHMGLAHYLNHDEIAPKYRRTVLESLTWPELEERQVAVG